MKQLEYNKPIEVSGKVRALMAHYFPGIIAHRTENGKHFIKRLWPAFRKETEEALNQFESKLI